ncbi:putative superfamily III holin-X [Glaciihabitans tibetensis]|uniref:Putative superfamily III holin-X n=1 Tax=Glaciihabitans tibetensis TaxID=1266600 RepID=A0A2T0VCK6_9MICO|nr:phage holin family protein [Glaciihabitans tibetensis]PRY67901.1 putative superfamily III holin-X [Glaciihabitans tibetensis]
MVESPPVKRRSLFQLVADVPTLVRELVMGEIELLKTEVINKLKIAGVGVGLILGAVIVLFFFIGVLLTAAVLGLAVVMPPWLAALVVAFVLLIAVAILAWIGYRELKKAMPPLPELTIKNLKRDINAVKGVGKRQNP